jgi:hypothetical protein
VTAAGARTAVCAALPVHLQPGLEHSCAAANPPAILTTCGGPCTRRSPCLPMSGSPSGWPPLMVTQPAKPPVPQAGKHWGQGGDTEPVRDYLVFSRAFWLQQLGSGNDGNEQSGLALRAEVQGAAAFGAFLVVGYPRGRPASARAADGGYRRALVRGAGRPPRRVRGGRLSGAGRGSAAGRSPPQPGQHSCHLLGDACGNHHSCPRRSGLIRLLDVSNAPY